MSKRGGRLSATKTKKAKKATTAKKTKKAVDDKEVTDYCQLCFNQRTVDQLSDPMAFRPSALHPNGMMQFCKDYCLNVVENSTSYCDVCQCCIWEGSEIFLSDTENAIYCDDCVPRCLTCLKPNRNSTCELCLVKERVQRCRTVAVALMRVKRTKQGQPTLVRWDKFLLRLIALHVFATRTEEEWQ